MAIYEKRSVIDTPAPALFAWHTRPGAFERLAPPWEHLRVVSRHGGISDGSRLTLELRRGPLKTRWEALHRDFIEGEQFTDVQVAGPFKRWEHTHRVEPAGSAKATLIDHVDYALPFGPIGADRGRAFCPPHAGSAVRVPPPADCLGLGEAPRSRAGPAPSHRADRPNRMGPHTTGGLPRHGRARRAPVSDQRGPSYPAVGSGVGPDAGARFCGAGTGRRSHSHGPGRADRASERARRARQPRAHRDCAADAGTPQRRAGDRRHSGNGHRTVGSTRGGAADARCAGCLAGA